MSRPQTQETSFISTTLDNPQFLCLFSASVISTLFFVIIYAKTRVPLRFLQSLFEKRVRILHGFRSREQSNHGKLRLQPYRLPQLRKGMSQKMTMGLKRLDKNQWLTFDDQYHKEHLIRSSHLDYHKRHVLRTLPDSEAACHELLDHVSSFLAEHFPDSFSIFESSLPLEPSIHHKLAEKETQNTENQKFIRNHLTGEVFLLGQDNEEPLETAARLAMEDFNILMKDPEGEYRLQASATLFPAGWRLEERIGGTMSLLHGPVPKWQEKLGASVNRYFNHLSATTAMERHTFFVQTVPELFQTCSLASATPSPSSSTTSLSSSSNSSTSPSPVVLPSSIRLRRERQTFTRLPKSNAVLFTVRTYLIPVTELDDDELEAMCEIAGGWSDAMAVYKGRDGWWDELRAYTIDRGLKVGENEEN